jgi:VWFA-related protein
MGSLVAEPGRHVLLLLSDGIDNQAEIINARPPATSTPKPPPPKGRGDAPTTCTRADVSVPQTLRDVMDRAERDTVMVYAVAVPARDPSGGVAIGPGSSGTGSASALAPPLLERDPRTDLGKLARRSGGSVHELNNYAQLKAAFKVIADELHLQYLLGFVPTKFDGERHEITVRVKRDGVTIRARESYRARIR